MTDMAHSLRKATPESLSVHQLARTYREAKTPPVKGIDALRDDAPLIPIDLPYAGEWRDRITHEEAAEWLTELRELGYNFPVDVIDAILEDADD